MKGVGEEDETRKGTWMEQEDVQLSCFVGVFGDRRWDYVAKVSGLNRTGKSCRLRWVNYLQPGLKRCKMTPHEEKLVLDLHSIWGNRWSRIASKLPGRTDNEIKNYWRTYMRKKSQKKKGASSKTLSSLSSSCSSASNDTKVNSLPSQAIFGEESFFCDTGGSAMSTTSEEISRSKDRSNNIEEEEEQESMDDVWREIALWSEDSVITPANNAYSEASSPPIWKMDDKLFYDGYDLYEATTSFNA